MFMQVIKETEINLIFSLFIYSVFLLFHGSLKITVNNSTQFLSKPVNLAHCDWLQLKIHGLQNEHADQKSAADVKTKNAAL